VGEPVEELWLRPLAQDGSDAVVMLPWLTDERMLDWDFFHAYQNT